MKILLFDIETAPNLAHVWSLWKQNVAVNQIIASGYVLCWAAKWYGEKKIMYHSIKGGTGGSGARGTYPMLLGIHSLLDQADIVVHYNGLHFDIPTLNREFVMAKMNPPTPYKQVDLLRVVREAFNFPSNRLEYVVKALKIGEKAKTEGHELWIKCMAGNAKAWKAMEAYNKQDTALLEPLYDRLKPWIKGHPNVGVLTDTSVCPTCGSEKIERRGLSSTQAHRYWRFLCRTCHTWFRGAYSVRSERPTTSRYVGLR